MEAHSGWRHGLAPRIARDAPPEQADLDLSQMGYEYADMPVVCYSDASLVSKSVSADCQPKQKWRGGLAACEIVPDGGALVFADDGNGRSLIQLCLCVGKHNVVSMA